jgi:peptidyl-prolyl cis-trans isomerase D
MAIIGKIRNNSTLVVGVVAGALILFVLSDFLGSKGGGGQNPEDAIAGEVFGQEINQLEYEREVQFQVEQAKQSAQQNNQPFTDETADRIREDIWSQNVNRVIFERELDGFNFVITPAELNDLIFGNNIQKYVMETPMFQNRFTQQFSVDSVKAWRQRIERSPEGKSWWVNNLETPVKDNRRISKYFNLIKQGMYVTNAEVMANHVANTRKIKVRFVTSQFDKIPDSTIAVKDDEIREYYNKHKHRKKYEQFGSRSFSWVEFLLKPSEADIDFAKKQAEGLFEQFKTAKNDSTFVMNFAETKTYDNNFSQAGAFPADVDSLVQKADSGQFIGPFKSGDSWKIVKVRATKTEEEARCRHILIGKQSPSGTPRTMDEIKKRADSLIAVIKKNNNFEEMVAKFTDDPGSKNTGGVYEWFTKGRMVKPFEEACFTGKLNVPIAVETEYGIHIVEPLGRRNAKRVKAATVDIKIRPMKETDMAVRSQAVEFLSKVKDATKFQEAAQNSKLIVQKREITFNQKSIDESQGYGGGPQGGTQGGRNVASWVHRANENDVSEPTIFNDRYVVIKLDNIKKKGIPEFEDVKDVMKLEVVRIKKGEMEAKKIAGLKSLDQIAAKYKTNIKDAELTFSSAVFPETTGTEYEVMGNVFGMKKVGDMSAPLKGKGGVYVVQIVSITEAPALTDMAPIRTQLLGGMRARAQDDSYRAIRELAKVDDKRSVY